MANFFDDIPVSNVPQGKNFFDDIPTEPPKGFFGREVDDLSKRRKQINEAGDAYRSGDKSMGRAALDIAGSYAGGIGDTASNAFNSAGKTLNDMMVPQPIQDAFSDFSGQAPGEIASTQAGRALGDASSYLKKNYPDQLAVAGDVANIATALLLVKPGAALLEAGFKAPGAGLDALAERKAAKTIAERIPDPVSSDNLNKLGYSPSMAEADPRAAALATALAKNPKATFNVQDLLKKRQGALDQAYSENVSPLYNKINATPIPEAPPGDPAMLGLQKTTAPLDDLVSKNPAVGDAIYTVTRNMGEAAPRDTMALLLKAREEVGPNLDARAAINKFITDNGGDITTPDALHKALKGTYAGTSPQVALDRIETGVNQGLRAGDAAAIKNTSISKIAAIPGNVLLGVKGLNPFTSYAPRALEKMAIDRRGQQALARLLLGQNKLAGVQ